MLVNLLGCMCLFCLLYFCSAAVNDTKGFIHKAMNITIIDDLSVLGWSGWCKLQPNGYECAETGIFPKFYFDLKLGYCKTADFGRCSKNYNKFDTVNECHATCVDLGLVRLDLPVSPKIYCRFQPAFGACNEYHPRYYFDVTQRECKGFSYSGCGGNLNRFTSFQVCSAICMPLVDYVLATSLKKT